MHSKYEILSNLNQAVPNHLADESALAGYFDSSHR